MKFKYHEFDGSGGFLGPDDLFPSPQIIKFIIQYGQEGLDALPDENEQIQELIQQMIDAGLLEMNEDGTLSMTPRMVKNIEQFQFVEIFRNMQGGVRGNHETQHSGRAEERLDGTKRYEFGDPLHELSLNQTLRNAISRQATDGPGGRDGAVLPLKLDERDFEVHQTESHSETAIVCLIDLSGSMMRYGRFIEAKRVALGLKALIERRFPQDSIHFVGFSSTAEMIPERELPLVMPKPITIRDWQVRIRVPLEQASQAPPHFTNLHHGLRMARSILSRQGAPNKQVFIITDGQPTAHIESTPGLDEEMLYLLYPPAEQTSQVTLKEAMHCSRQGIRFSTFALIEDYQYMDWVSFVEQMTRLVKGVAFYCTAGDLAGIIMESYLSGKKTKKSIGP